MPILVGYRAAPRSIAYFPASYLLLSWAGVAMFNSGVEHGLRLVVFVLPSCQTSTSGDKSMQVYISSNRTHVNASHSTPHS
jgi:hypothetical protein